MVGKSSKIKIDSSFSETLERAFYRREPLRLSSHTTAYRLLWGDYEGLPGITLERYGDAVLLLHKPEISQTLWTQIARWVWEHTHWSVVVKSWGKSNSDPIQILHGTLADPLYVLEHGKTFVIRFQEGCSPGLFLDLREQRNLLPAGTSFLNLFSYTSSFSVYAALKGYKTFSVDLSAKYLDWSKENFQRNNILLTQHFFYQGDAREWVKRFKKKAFLFDYVVIDPPSFSTGKKGVFSVKQHLSTLVYEVCDLLAPQAKIQISTNLEQWPKNQFQQEMRQSIQAKKQIQQEVWFSPAIDFPLPKTVPFYLKCLTFHVSS